MAVNTGMRKSELLNLTWNDVDFHQNILTSKLMMKGANLYDVKELLGHESIETTQIYAHLSKTHSASIIGLLNE